MIDSDRLASALHRWKTEREGNPTPHTEWWASHCHDCKDDADRIIGAYESAGMVSGESPEQAEVRPPHETPAVITAESALRGMAEAADLIRLTRGFTACVCGRSCDFGVVYWVATLLYAVAVGVLIVVFWS